MGIGRSLSGFGEFEVNVLAGKLLVDTRERVELVLEGGGILLVEEAVAKVKTTMVSH